MLSLPAGTEMFHFPTFPPHALCVQARVTPHDWCGVPPFGNPRINARLTAPRGLSQPPTSFIGSWCQGIHRAPLITWPHKNPATPPPGRTCGGPTRTLQHRVKDARVHCAVLKVRPVTASLDPARPGTARGDRRYENSRALTESNRSPAPSGPNSVPTTAAPAHHPVPRTPEGGCTGSGEQTARPNWSAFHPRAPPRHVQPRMADHPGRARLWTTPRGCGQVLLRKEVIQPHLPVRLPCYDFVPIADPAFDGSLPQGVGPPASGVTDFRDVTGGVYKARERIHRSVADLRLLATPTSWGRVADPNPN